MPISPLPWRVDGHRIVDANGQECLSTWEKRVVDIDDAGTVTAIVCAMNDLGALLEATQDALTTPAELHPAYRARLEAALRPFLGAMPVTEKSPTFGTSPIAKAIATLHMRDVIMGRRPVASMGCATESVHACEVCNGPIPAQPQVAPKDVAARCPSCVTRFGDGRRPSPWGSGRLVEAVTDRCPACDGYGRTSTGHYVDICEACEGTGGFGTERPPAIQVARAMGLPPQACEGRSRLVDDAVDRCTSCDGYGCVWNTSGPEVTICEDCDGTGGLTSSATGPPSDPDDEYWK